MEAPDDEEEDVVETVGNVVSFDDKVRKIKRVTLMRGLPVHRCHLCKMVFSTPDRLRVGWHGAAVCVCCRQARGGWFEPRRFQAHMLKGVHGTTGKSRPLAVKRTPVLTRTTPVVTRTTPVVKLKEIRCDQCNKYFASTASKMRHDLVEHPPKYVRAKDRAHSADE